MIRSPRSVVQLLFAGMLLGMLILAAGRTSAQSPVYGEPRFDRPALDAMLAPVALYPDPLLSQVLMAATYPREIDEAARWLREQPGLGGDAAVRAAEGWDWDPSVRSLLAFPNVLQTLADYPAWTEDLGEAFLVQREDVMDTIQQLRRRAIAAGTLRSTESTRVVDTGYAITIETASPQTVYVPYYDPRVAYGAWWWPARPPMSWSRWPGYHVPPGRDPLVYWGPGVHLGAGFFFGNFVWSRREVRVVDVRPYYYPRTVVIERHVVPGRPVIERRAPVPDTWRPDFHRRDPRPRRDDFRSPPPQDSRAFEPRRSAPPRREFDDRGPGPRYYGPSGSGERRDFDRYDGFNAPRGPAGSGVAPAPSAPPRPAYESRPPRSPEEFRGSPRPEGRGGDRRGDDLRRGEEMRRGDDMRMRAPAAQVPTAPPRSAPPQQQPQRYLDANEERPAGRRHREARD